MSQKLTLDQQRAKYAWEKTDEAAQRGIIDEYSNLAKSVASLIMNSGLMQTFAFLQAKGDKQHKALLEHLMEWLVKMNIAEDVQDPMFAVIMKGLQKSSSSNYMRATSETMVLLRWIRQFSDARKSMEKAS